jgi:ABC-type transport system involved in multi-copper enzyme maturation permease subunit
MSGLSLARVGAIVRKELRELASNRGLLASLGALPAILAATPWLAVWAYSRQPNDLAMREMARYYHVLQAGIAPGASLIEATVEKWLGLFLVAPMFLPVLISSQAVAGEKEKRTIEPLLASPASELEILLGKSLASVVPAVLFTWAFFALFAAGVDFLSYPLVGHLLVPDRGWAFGMLVLAPLLSLFGNAVAVAISARVNDPRLAQQLAALCVMPMVAVGTVALSGLAQVGPLFYVGLAPMLAVLDIGVLGVAVRLFDRERVLTRWG